jgi:hypothetical protein
MNTMTKLSRWVVLSVLLFEAAGALVGGPALVASPDGAFMKIPVADLQGVLNAAAFAALLRRLPSAWLWVGLALGGFLVWFIVELALVGAKSWAQAAWGIPVLIGLAAALPLEKEHFSPSGRLIRLRS